MIEEFFMGIVSGVVTSAILYFLNGFYEIKAISKIEPELKLIETYLVSISNDLIWGVEDSKEDYYDNLILKANFVLLYIDNVKKSIKPLNFILHHRKYILYQINEIERYASTVLTEVVGDTPKEEKLSRMKTIFEENCADIDMIVTHRINFLFRLFKFTRLSSAIENCSVGNSENDYEIIKKELAKK